MLSELPSHQTQRATTNTSYPEISKLESRLQHGIHLDGRVVPLVREDGVVRREVGGPVGRQGVRDCLVRDVVGEEEVQGGAVRE